MITYGCAGKPFTHISGPTEISDNATGCYEQPATGVLIEKLSIAGPEAIEAANNLRVYASKSPACRKQIIDGLMNAMDKPDLDLIADRQSYLLWLRGSAILGELQATEALDLLVNHLDLTDGQFSASMVHQPAMIGVRAMGVAAVPKLTSALKNSANRHIRLAAAFSLVDIGGREAIDALKQASASDSDHCIREFIKLSLDQPQGHLKSTAKSYPDKEADLLRKRLLAFRCGR
jgi:hypothetical protein